MIRYAIDCKLINVTGRGFYGIMNSGCPETFQSSQQFQQGERGAGSRFQDRHQKIGQFKQGDIIAFPAGAAHWAYNEGNEELVLVCFEDSGNSANQLDQNSRVCKLFNNTLNID